ncbi:hypothetical protein AAVH_19963 [Aphelenchoides avenae]|nr:hypothetical protein AAVH_19963 [Aphelenchus avenae]
MDNRLLMFLSLLGLCSGVAGRNRPGGEFPIDPKSPEVLALADEVVAKVQADKSLFNCLFRDEVYNATKQVVAGFAYRFTFRAALSECTLPDCAQKIKYAHCQRANSIPALNIKANIWDKPSGEKQIKYEILH